MADDVSVMAQLSSALEADYRTSSPDPWLGSPFEWIHRQPPARKGAIGKEMFRRWATAEGFTVDAPPLGAVGDCAVNGLTLVVKFGLLWKAGMFTFEQIREQPYDAVALLGLEPHDVRLWVVPGADLWDGSDEQHGPDTHWLRFRPSQPPAVTAPFGGTLAAARESLLKQARGNR